MRRSTKRRPGEVRTIVEVGSLAASGSHAMCLRIDISAMVFRYGRVLMLYWAVFVVVRKCSESRFS